MPVPETITQSESGHGTIIAGICEKHVAILVMTVTIEVSRGSNPSKKTLFQKKKVAVSPWAKKKVAVSPWAVGAWN